MARISTGRRSAAKTSAAKNSARKSSAGRNDADQLLGQTSELVTRLIRENRVLKSQNLRLNQELDRLGKGWDLIRQLAGQAPKRRRS